MMKRRHRCHRGPTMMRQTFKLIHNASAPYSRTIPALHRIPVGTDRAPRSQLSILRATRMHLSRAQMTPSKVRPNTWTKIPRLSRLLYLDKARKHSARRPKQRRKTASLASLRVAGSALAAATTTSKVASHVKDARSPGRSWTKRVCLHI